MQQGTAWVELVSLADFGIRPRKIQRDPDEPWRQDKARGPLEGAEYQRLRQVGL